MSRTTVNVLGDLVATAFVGKSEGEWSPAMLPPSFVEAGGARLDESPDSPDNSKGEAAD
jgi:Na+/H+-dicarboxylate symporter